MNGFSDHEINHGQINLTNCAAQDKDSKITLLFCVSSAASIIPFGIIFFLLLLLPYTTVLTALPHGSKGMAVKKFLLVSQRAIARAVVGCMVFITGIILNIIILVNIIIILHHF